MAAYKGNAGVVLIGDDPIGELTNFTVTETGGTAEDSSLGDEARTYLPDGLPTWTGSITAHYDPGDTDGQAVIFVGAVLALTFNFLGTATGVKNMSGSGIVTQAQFGELANGAVIPFSCSLQGSGPLVRGVVAAP
jgi:hypothetical protein